MVDHGDSVRRFSTLASRAELSGDRREAARHYLCAANEALVAAWLCIVDTPLIHASADRRKIASVQSALLFVIESLFPGD